MSGLSHTAFLGDAEYSFRLTPALIVELEKTCGPLGLICQRVFNRQFAQSDITETIRLALIGGGGANPKRAAELIAAYVADRPLAETYPLANKILERRWFGTPHETVNG
jgi:hypothetical protein